MDGRNGWEERDGRGWRAAGSRRTGEGKRRGRFKCGRLAGQRGRAGYENRRGAAAEKENQQENPEEAHFHKMIVVQNFAAAFERLGLNLEKG